MKKSKQAIKAINLATNETFIFPASYRYGTDPKHMFAPPFFTDETAFHTHGMLKDAPIGSEVYIEWCRDKFYSLDINTKEYVPGSTVWRKSKVIEHVLAPTPEA